MSHYDALEVSPNASPEVIRAAYKSLMQRFHPDKNPGDEAVGARAAAIVQAYEVLSDAGKRAAYNSSLLPATRPAARLAQGERPGPAFSVVRVGFWCLLLLIAVGSFWAVASRTAKKIDPRAELVSIRQAFASKAATEAQRREMYARKLGILEQQPELSRAASAEVSEDMAARTFSLLETPLVVPLVVPAANETPAGVAELTIQNISLLIGSFDAPVLLAHLAKHREQLIQDLSERLAKADPGRLSSPNGEQVLKRVVLDAAVATLGTDPGQTYPSTYFESPGRYGVVDVVLPERFKLIQLSSLR